MHTSSKMVPGPGMLPLTPVAIQKKLKKYKVDEKLETVENAGRTRGMIIINYIDIMRCV